MTEEAAPAAAPAAAAPAAAPAAQPAPAAAAPAAAAPAEYQHPEAFKDKPYLKNMKTVDDVYKALDGAQALIGQKTIQPIDYTTATPEQIAEHHAKLAPQDVTAYELPADGDPTLTKAAAESFKKLGLTAYQGRELAKDINAIAAEIAKGSPAVDTSEAGYMKLMEAKYGDKTKTVAAFAETTLKAIIPKEEIAVFDEMPNEQRAIVDRVLYEASQKYEARIAAILKEHGVTETGSQGEGNRGGITNDVGAQRTELRKQIRELTAKPHHKASDVQALKDKLAATYSTPSKR